MRGALLKSLMAMASLPIQRASQPCARLVPRLVDQATPTARLLSTAMTLNRKDSCGKCGDCTETLKHDYSGRTKPPCEKSCKCERPYSEKDDCDEWAGTRRGKKNKLIRKWSKHLKASQWQKYMPKPKPKCDD